MFILLISPLKLFFTSFAIFNFTFLAEISIHAVYIFFKIPYCIIIILKFLLDNFNIWAISTVDNGSDLFKKLAHNFD